MTNTIMYMNFTINENSSNFSKAFNMFFSSVEKTPNADEDASSYSKFNENEDHSEN